MIYFLAYIAIGGIFAGILMPGFQKFYDMVVLLCEQRQVKPMTRAQYLATYSVLHVLLWPACLVGFIMNVGKGK